MIPLRPGRVLAVLALIASGSGPAVANTFTETFTGGSSASRWSERKPARLTVAPTGA